MSRSINPYQTPVAVDSVPSLTDEEGDCIRFEGYLQENDIRQLLHKPNFIWALRLLYPVVVIPLFAIPIMGLFVGGPLGEGTLAVVGFLLFLSSLFVTVEWMSSRSQLTKRLLKKYPDWCNQHLQGELSPRGLSVTVDRANEKHHIGWVRYTRLLVNEHGIHLGYPDPDGSFFAIAAHMIKDFERDAIRTKIRAYQRSSDRTGEVTLEPDWSGAPSDAIRFVSTLSNGIQATVNEKPLSKLWKHHAWWVAQATGVLLLVLHWSGAFANEVVGMIALVVGLVATIWGAKHWPRESATSQWVWGWFTPDGMVLKLVGQTANVRWDQTQSVRCDEDCFECVVNEHVRFEVTPDELRSGSWSQLVGWQIEQKSARPAPAESTDESPGTQDNTNLH